MFFVLRLPSLQSTWLVQRSVTVCCPSVVSVSHPFSTRHLSIPQLQFSLQSRLGVLLPSRQPSLLVMLPCVDDFQCPCFSSSACCWLCSSRLLLAVLCCLQLAMLFCHFVQLSEILVDLLLVVDQVLRLCAPFRQSGVASFVDFSSSLALLAVMLSPFSVFWRRFLQIYLVVVYCAEVRLMHLQRHHSACATS